MRLALLAALALVAPPARDFTNSLGADMVRIAPGEFLMGSPREEADRQAALMKEKKITSWYPESPKSEAPPRRTKITKAFHLGAHETTLGEFRKFAAETGYRTDAEKDGKGADGKVAGKWTTKPEFNWKDMGYDRTDDYPVVNVTWNDAVAVCEWLSKKEGRKYRLPTEAEWEYACRAGTSTPSFWGDEDEKRNDHAWTGANSGGGPHPVGKLKPNAWGLYDMLGNVYEYVQDWWSPNPYDPAQSVDPAGPARGTAKIVRSTSWGTNAMHARSAFRGSAGLAHRNMRDGFRVACDAE